ncbi:MAG TPA: tRNA-dihydrouridine synthase [Anaerolineales bacterium]
MKGKKGKMGNKGMEVPQAPSFRVDTIPVYGDLILSPMDGISDLPFRSVCRELGSAMSYTEFINALDIVMARRMPPKIVQKLAFLPEERPVVFQIFDSDPDRLLQVALRLQEYRPDIIDINMGCSDSSVSGRGAGAGLLRTPFKIARIFRKLSRALDVPVTGKIRLGWDETSRNHVLIARIIEENGGALVAVHGRTKMQGYRGQADWDAIAEVKQSVSIPVIGNGDVSVVADIERIKAYTGCDAVMIGRAAFGNPWIFSRLDRAQVTPEQVRATLQRHLERMLAYYDGDYGLVVFRKHASRYLSPYPITRDQRQSLFTAERPAEFMQVFNSVFCTVQ